MFKYRIYGLNVLSELHLDCYPSDFENEDIHIWFTKSEYAADCYISQFCNREKPIVIESSECAGKFYVCGNNNVIVYYQSEHELKCSLIHYLLGFISAYILYMRKIYLLHGSCITFNDFAVVFLGESGAGKSSLATGFTQIGGKILTDDITRIDLRPKIPYVFPSFPTHRLRKNTIEHLDIDMSCASELIGENDKFLLSGANKTIFINEITPVKAIVYISPSDTEEVMLVRENIQNSLFIISKNVYNNGIISISDSMGDYFNFIVEICDKIPVYTIQRPRNSFTIREQMDIVLREIYNEDKVL